MWQSRLKLSRELADGRYSDVGSLAVAHLDGSANGSLALGSLADADGRYRAQTKTKRPGLVMNTSQTS